MSIFNIGDEFVILRDSNKINGFDSGDHVVLIGFERDGCHKFKSKRNGKILYFYEDGVKKIESSSFKTSNRYKLHKYILSTGFTKQDLSLALNKNQSYLATETRESQFTNRGDMSDARYKFLRKQIKEVVYKLTTEFANSVPTNVGISGGEITQTLANVEPKEKEYLHYDSSVGLNGGYDDGVCVIYDGEIVPAAFAVAMDMKQKTLNEKVKEAKEALDTFTAPKPSNNGAFILGLVFFVMLIIFGIGCLIYKAA